ncbi:MAG TPA: hypothetical protein VHU43_03925 [Steroidobacteraceae bacterium]|nr:hypothetical protein [Steroidobacteraceae bacterium]
MRKADLANLILACALLTACSKQAQPPTRPPAAASSPAAQGTHPPATTGARVIPGSKEGESAQSFFDPKNYPDAAQGTFIDPQKLTATERKYGMAPKRDARVIYQDGVILMEHGDEAIREAKTDGMTFRFDAKAEHVGEFEEGEIIFATGRVVGRVGQLTRDGDTVTVKLAPVQITEIVKQGTFMIHSDFSPKDLIIYTAPDFPNTNDVTAKQQSDNFDREFSEPRYLRAGFLQTQLALPSGLGKNLSITRPWMPDTGDGPVVNIPSSGLKVVPAIGSDGGIGINFSYVKSGIVFNGYGQMVLPTPHVDFLLVIDSSGIKTFGIEISGSISLRMAIEATSDLDQYINVNSTTASPIDISLPCPVAGLPLALSFHTSFNLHTNFEAKRSSLMSSGSWGLNGKLFAGYKGGQKSHDTPDSQATSRLVSNVSGLSVGINTIGGAVNVRPMIGLGGFGFMTGVFLGVTFTADISKQASQVMVDCHVASGSASIDSGVGYQLPGPIVAFVNTILKLFTTYQMAKDGVLIQGWGGPLFKINEDIPKTCGGFSDGAPPAAT